MRQYIARRLLLFVPTLIGVSIIIFTIMRVVPGDVAMMILVGPDGSGSVDPKQYEALRHELGLDKPVFVDLTSPGSGSQYGDWVWGVVRGKWGESLRSDTPVLENIRTRLPLTFEIATLTMVISVLIAIPLGVVMAVRRDGWVDYVSRMVSIGGLAMPSFWVATLMLLAMVLWFNWTPPLGYTHFWEDPWVNIRQVIWPCMALGYLLSAIVARMTRSSLLEVLRQDYIRTAWAKGLAERSIVIKHVLKNSLLPVVTIVGLQYAALLGGTVIMETQWNLPGLGLSLIDSINFRDYPMVQGLVLVFSFFILTMNLLVDLAYAWLDPRVRYQ